MEASVKKFAKIVLVAALACCLAACGQSTQSQSSKGVDYADDEAMDIIAQGFEDRQEVVAKAEEDGTSSTSEGVKDAVNAELKVDKQLKDRKFKDSELREYVLRYINNLNDSLDLVESYDIDDIDFYVKWQELYGQREELLKKFVDDYGLTVDEEYQGNLDDLVAEAEAAADQSAQGSAINALADDMTFEKTEDSSGYTYTCTAENTSEYDYTYVSLVVELYDKDWDKIGEVYADPRSWDSGETVTFEVWSDQNAANARAVVSYYEVS